MKKLHIVLWIVIASLFVGGAVIGFVGFAMADFQPQKLDGGAYEAKSYTATTKPSAVKELLIDVPLQDISIFPTDSKEITIDYTENQEQPFRISEQNGRLEITQEKTGNWYDQFFNFRFQKDELMIQLPKEFIGTITATSSNGNIYVSDLSSLQYLECHASNGEILLENLFKINGISCETSNAQIWLQNVASKKDITLKTSNGLIRLDEISATGAVQGKTSNAMVYMNQSNAEDCELITSNGMLSLDHCSVKNTINAKTSNALLTLYQVEGKDITLKSSNGEITGGLIGNMDEYQIESHTSNGSNSLPEQKATGTKFLRAETSNANIEIGFTEK